MIIVIGGGPAGMMAAIKAAQTHDVILLEKQKHLGNKLLLTGQGRCNITNASSIADFVATCHGEPDFLYTHLNRFGPREIVDFFQQRGCPLVLENHRYYPKSMKARDILNVLEDELRQKVTVRTNAEVKELITVDNRITQIKLADETLDVNHVVLATGGLSFPMTGSSGDGFMWLKELSHQVSDLFASEVGLISGTPWIEAVVGLSLRDTWVTLKVDNKKIKRVKGDLIFTHQGISGPAILDLSYHAVKNLRENRKVSLNIQVIEDEKVFNSNKKIKNYLEEKIPKRLVEVVLSLIKLDKNKQTNQLLKQERSSLQEVLQGLVVEINDSMPIEKAVVTAGGLKLNQVNPKTLISKRIVNLSICGELLNVVGPVGGYNLTIALSTGYGAGSSIE